MSRRLILALIALSALALWLYQRRVAKVPPSIPFTCEPRVTWTPPEYGTAVYYPHHYPQSNETWCYPVDNLWRVTC